MRTYKSVLAQVTAKPKLAPKGVASGYAVIKQMLPHLTSFLQATTLDFNRDVARRYAEQGIRMRAV